MSQAALSPPPVLSLSDPAFKQKLQDLRRTDNFTNLFYLAAVYLFLGVVLAGTIWFYHFRPEAGLSLWWNVPVTVVAVLLIGAGQHQLTGLAHEAVHHTFLRNRLANDLVSDWFCLFPLFSNTHHYRLQHLAHHQFVNDPVRDPDVSQLQQSGHWLTFPVSRGRFLLTLLKQLWVPNLIKYIRTRAQYNALGTDHNPYLPKGYKRSRVATRVGLLYLLTLLGSLTALVYLGNALLLAVVPAALWLAALAFYARLPERYFSRSRIHPVISMRAMTLQRITYLTALFAGLAWLTVLTGAPAWLYYFLLWLVPIGTSFAFFMILRQLVQHGNGGRGWLSNTRTFRVHPLIHFCVFPMGQDYHLPHHLFVSVPHYRLRGLHELLLCCREYRDEAVVVEGYFLPRQRPPARPTVLDVLGPAYAPAGRGVYVDDTVLEGEEVDDREEILQEGEQLRQSSPLAPASGERGRG